ncbi:MAG: hypothetical protein A2Y67_00635 [Candidatus Buchananbacteria bacterium RBG_13_39_9]|uniref:Uncharacterized protein n=1 Tax=Candidatus Buchananbacteria bacterium RBG_13_39_9 TaxID=1797531 RepID=A0A1G1XNU8_9BACT|nr:MAG: hypothetical protein A2Y67_00635 [Candidatus Buchananbacteria bacterium RBG_13_39_9]
MAKEIKIIVITTIKIDEKNYGICDPSCLHLGLKGRSYTLGGPKYPAKQNFCFLFKVALYSYDNENEPMTRPVRCEACLHWREEIFKGEEK